METKIATILFYVLIELTYLVSIIWVIILGIRFLKKCSNPKLLLLTKSVLLFSAFSFLSTVAINTFNHSIIQRTIYFFYLSTELAFITILLNAMLEKTKAKAILATLLILTSIYLLNLTVKVKNFDSYHPFFAAEAFIAGSIALVYFRQLTKSLEKQNLFEQPATWIILGLYFCYSLPLAIYTFSSFITIFDPNSANFLSSITQSKKFVFIGFTRLMTISYIVFNYFLVKAFKCNTYITTTGR
jgi:hypothetical protein